MICKNCGNNISVSDAKCPYCGAASAARSGGNGFFDILSPEVMNAAPAKTTGAATGMTSGINERRIMEEIARRESFFASKLKIQNILSISALTGCAVLLCMSMVLFVNQSSASLEVNRNKASVDAMNLKIEQTKDSLNVNKAPDVPTLDYLSYDEGKLAETSYYKRTINATNKNYIIRINMNLDAGESLVFSQNNDETEFEGTEAKDIMFADGASLNNPERNGYIFAGWSREGAVYGADGGVPETYTANWVKDSDADMIPDMYQTKVLCYAKESYKIKETADGEAVLYGVDRDAAAQLAVLQKLDLYDENGNYTHNGKVTINVNNFISDITSETNNLVKYRIDGFTVKNGTEEFTVDEVNGEYKFDVTAGFEYILEPVYKRVASFTVETYIIGNDGTAEVSIADVYEAFVGEIVTAENEDYINLKVKNGYFLNKSFEGSVLLGQVEENSFTTGENGESVLNELVLKCYYEKDAMGGFDAEHKKIGDGVADRMQKEVTFKIKNGYFDGNTEKTVTYGYCMYNEAGTAVIEANPPMRIFANDGYTSEGGAWSFENLPITLTKDDKAEFVFECVKIVEKIETVETEKIQPEENKTEENEKKGAVQTDNQTEK